MVSKLRAQQKELQKGSTSEVPIKKNNYKKESNLNLRPRERSSQAQ